MTEPGQTRRNETLRQVRRMTAHPSGKRAMCPDGHSQHGPVNRSELSPRSSKRGKKRRPEKSTLRIRETQQCENRWSFESTVTREADGYSRSLLTSQRSRKPREQKRQRQLWRKPREEEVSFEKSPIGAISRKRCGLNEKPSQLSGRGTSYPS
jgi:hypothetical protein